MTLLENTPFERRVLTVSQLTGRIRDLLGESIGPVWLEGEISGVRRPASGHTYLTLKDDQAQIRAVIFRQRGRQIAFRPEDGLTVLAFGRLTVYEPRGEYQLIIDHLEPLGAGALAVAFDQLKAKLTAEGLFDQAGKRPLPPLPRQLALVTSISGAAMWDFLRIARRRFRGLHIQVYPVQVQGEAAPGQIAQALADLAGLNPPPEVIILARGGGSLEDLWAFNTEIVARAVAACPVPVVSAVGHEVDFTIADFTADLRASTPSAAAELLVRPQDELRLSIAQLTERLFRAGRAACRQARAEVAGLIAGLADPGRRVEHWRLRVAGAEQRLYRLARRLGPDRRARLAAAVRRLTDLKPEHRLRLTAFRAAELTGLLQRAMQNRLAKERQALAGRAERLAALSPLNVLARGYSLTSDSQGRLVRSYRQVALGERVGVRLAEGRLVCRVDKTAAE